MLIGFQQDFSRVQYLQAFISIRNDKSKRIFDRDKNHEGSKQKEKARPDPRERGISLWNLNKS
jgi:hypothetical protein